MKFGYAIIYVAEVVEAVDFYRKAFGLEPGFIHESEDYAEMNTGATKLAFVSHELASTEVPAKYHKLDEGAPAGFEYTLTTSDVEGGFRQAVAAGAQALAEPHSTSWGQTVSYVRDPFGVLVGIASPIS